MPMPRKLASRTKLVALVTKTLFAVTHLIRASSTKSIMKLANTSLARSLVLPAATAGPGVPAGGLLRGRSSSGPVACPFGCCAGNSPSAPVMVRPFPGSSGRFLIFTM